MENIRTRKYSEDLNEPKIKYIEYCQKLLLNEDVISNTVNALYRFRDYEVNILNGKDISDASYHEILGFFKFIGSGSEDSLQIYKFRLEGYRAFCKEERYSEATVDVMDMFTSEVLATCVDSVKTDTKYITEVEFSSLINKIPDSQNIAVFELLYNGFKGVAYKEIIDLKKSDIDFEKKLVYGKEVSDRLLDSLKRAIHEDLISGYDLDGSETDFKLIDSDYVIRPTETYADKNVAEKVTAGMLIRRIGSVCKGYDKTYYITPDSIYRSGMFNRALEFVNLIDEKTCRRDFTSYMENYEGVSKAMAYKMFKIFYNTYLPKVSNEGNNQRNNAEE